MSRRHEIPRDARIPDIDFTRATRDPYARYARHILGYRHFASGRDGLLPSQRRALWTLKQMGATSRGSATKTSKAAGFTCGNYHPHGDASMAATIANMTQFKSNASLVTGIGNFGWHDAKPAAPRYTNCYLSPYALSMMDASELAVVPMDRSYDGKNEEPRHLPARLPHLLVGGCSGIGAGYRCDVPPCDADWVLDAVLRTARDERLVLPRAFGYRWGGTLKSLDPSWLRTGNGSAVFVPSVVAEQRRVLITSLAPGLNVEAVVAHMTRCADLGTITEETPEHDEIVRLVCTLRRGGDVGALRTHALLLRGRAQGYSFLHIRQFDTPLGVDYLPIEESPVAYLRRWVRWRTHVVARAAEWRASEHRKAIAWQKIVLRAIAHQDDLAAALKSSTSKDDLALRVRAILRCALDEAVRIIELQFYRLAHMNVNGIRAQIADHAASARREDAIASAPLERMLENAHDAREKLRVSAASERKKPKSRRKS